MFSGKLKSLQVACTTILTTSLQAAALEFSEKPGFAPFEAGMSGFVKSSTQSRVFYSIVRLSDNLSLLLDVRSSMIVG